VVNSVRQLHPARFIFQNNLIGHRVSNLNHRCPVNPLLLMKTTTHKGWVLTGIAVIDIDNPAHGEGA